MPARCLRTSNGRHSTYFTTKQKKTRPSSRASVLVHHLPVLPWPGYPLPQLAGCDPGFVALPTPFCCILKKLEIYIKQRYIIDSRQPFVGRPMRTRILFPSQFSPGEAGDLLTYSRAFSPDTDYWLLLAQGACLAVFACIRSLLEACTLQLRGCARKCMSLV